MKTASRQISRRSAGVAALALACALAGPASAAPIPIDQMDAPQALDFLRGTIISQGKIVYHADYSNVQNGDSWTADFTDTFEDVRIYPNTCNISFHFIESRDGSVVGDYPDAGITFAHVDAITTSPEASRRDKSMAQEGRTNDRVRISPEIWSVNVFKNGGYVHLPYYSKDMADQAAETASRLRALCRKD